MPSFRHKPSMDLQVPVNLAEYVSNIAKQNKELEVSISEAVDARTLEQNALFHVLVRQLAEQAGSDLEWMKEYIKSQAVKFGYPVWIQEGQLRTDINGEALPKPTSEADVKDLMLLIETCYWVANENGFELKQRV